MRPVRPHRTAAGEVYAVTVGLRYWDRVVHKGAEYVATAPSENRRRITVYGFSEDGELTYVRRSTSRRTQAIRTASLVGRYEPRAGPWPRR